MSAVLAAVNPVTIAEGVQLASAILTAINTALAAGQTTFTTADVAASATQLGVDLAALDKLVGPSTPT